jgi:hypothetical protein
VTRARPADELRGLVYSLTERPRSQVAWYLRPSSAAIVVVALVVILNLYFY